MEHLVEIRHGNACAVDDLSSATVCFAYLLPKGNAKLSKKLMRSMAPGSRVVTYVFRLPEEHWDEHLETCKAVASTRDRGRGRGGHERVQQDLRVSRARDEARMVRELMSRRGLSLAISQ